MNVKITSVKVEEIKSSKVSAEIVFTDEMFESEETYTWQQLFQMLTQSQPVAKIGANTAEDNITKTIRANITQSPEQILALVKQSEAMYGRQVNDQAIALKIDSLKRA